VKTSHRGENIFLKGKMTDLGTPTPNASAQLDVSSTTAGLTALHKSFAEARLKKRLFYVFSFPKTL
jgi:hypothetical protein